MKRALFLAMFAVCGFGMTSPAPAQSSVAQYAFCIQSNDYPGWSGCSFNTFEACQATASGTGGECLANPWYQPGANAAPAPDSGNFFNNGPLPVGPPPH
jgi:hypothetical protein